MRASRTLAAALSPGWVLTMCAARGSPVSRSRSTSVMVSVMVPTRGCSSLTCSSQPLAGQRCMPQTRVLHWGPSTQRGQFGFDVGPGAVLELVVHVLGGEDPWTVQEGLQDATSTGAPRTILDERVLGADPVDVGLVVVRLRPEDRQVGVEQDRRLDGSAVRGDVTSSREMTGIREMTGGREMTGSREMTSSCADHRADRAA